MLARANRHLDGPPIPLPRALDAAAERWWRARPRTRLLLGLSVLAAVVVAGLAHAAASPYGPPTEVWLAARDLPVGHVIASGDVRRATWPRDLVPAGALRDPVGSVRVFLPTGTVVTDRHLGDDGIAAGLPPGTAAVAVPHDALPPLPEGTRVDLVAVDLDGRAVPLTTGAVVLAADDVALWIAVERVAAPEVAGAGQAGALGVVVVPD